MPAATIALSTRIGAPAASARAAAATAPRDQARSSRIATSPAACASRIASGRSAAGNRARSASPGPARTSGDRSQPDRAGSVSESCPLPLKGERDRGPRTLAGGSRRASAALRPTRRPSTPEGPGFLGSRRARRSFGAPRVSRASRRQTRRPARRRGRARRISPATVRTCALSLGGAVGRRISLRHQDGQTSAKTIPASSGGARPVSNGQMRARSAQRGSSRNAPHDRDAGQRLAADRAGIGEFPARLRPDHPFVDQPALLQRLVGGRAAMMASARESRRASPAGHPQNGNAPAGNATVERRADLEAVVAVVVVVLDQPARSRPTPRATAGRRDRAGRRTQRGSRTGNRSRPAPARPAPLPRRAFPTSSALARGGSPGFRSSPRPGRGGRPRCCRGRSWPVRRAPIDDHVMVEQAGMPLTRGE